MAKTKPIRDPVHNYIPTTPIEESIIDSREFQRLRFILQNSSAYLTYPSSTNNRFLHSLGVMHLSGLLFINALRNASTKTLIKYLQESDETLRKYEAELSFDINVYTKQWQKLLGNVAQFSHEPFCGGRIEFIYEEHEDDRCLYYLSNGESKLEVDHDPYYIINTLWQALRLVALMHDIGHLPMSHLFERVIDDCLISGRQNLQETIKLEISKRKEQYKNQISHSIEKMDEFSERVDAKTLPLHELRGLTIFEKIYKPKPENSSAIYIALIYRIAKDIFYCNQ